VAAAIAAVTACGALAVLGLGELRFTHAEEIFPAATLLGLLGSTKQLPAGTEVSYADDPFLGAEVASMGANIQWDLFRYGNKHLVRMLYNEKQAIAFHGEGGPEFRAAVAAVTARLAAALDAGGRTLASVAAVPGGGDGLPLAEPGSGGGQLVESLGSQRQASL
jgi:hypothetical protein